MGLRDISDDNDEVRDISSHDSKGYPYTYPITYADEEGSRDISDPEE